MPSSHKVGAYLVAFASPWMLLPILPLLNLTVLPMGDFIHDRYLYLPSVGWAMLVAMALAHLDLPQAIAFNPLATLGALVFLLGGAAAAVASLAGRPLPEPRLSGPAPRSAALLAVAANWAWLLLHPPPA